MKEKISRVSLIVYVVLLLLSFTLMSMPGDNIEWFCIMGICAIPPIIAGSKLYRILGVIALLIAIALSVADYHAGQVWKENFQKRLKQQEEKKSAQSKDAISAIHLAEKCLVENKIQLENYKLIKAENLYINNSKYIGPNNWYVVFKSKDLISDSNGPIGMGGEVFVEADVKNTKAKILGYGE